MRAIEPRIESAAPPNFVCCPRAQTQMIAPSKRTLANFYTSHQPSDSETSDFVCFTNPVRITLKLKHLDNVQLT
jgi:hypothetical protein